MFDHTKKSLFVFSHPNHEIAVYGIVQRTRPSVAFLTDGGGGARLAQTGQGLQAAGLSSGISYFNHTEESLYHAVLRKDTSFFDAMASQLAELILTMRPFQILCDGVEYYNPIHDIALPVTLLAVQKAKLPVLVFAVPLVYQASGTSEDFVFQRALPEQRPLEEAFKLKEQEAALKRKALKNIYTALMAQMAFPLEVIEQGCRMEHIVQAGFPPATADPGCVIRYNHRGEEARRAGGVREAITYAGHFLPLVKELLSR